jgi:hypothetical protein
MSYSDAAWERAMTVEEVIWKALSGGTVRFSAGVDMGVPCRMVLLQESLSKRAP